MEIKNKKRFVKWVWALAFAPVAMVLLALLCVGIFAPIPSFEELEDPKSNPAKDYKALYEEVMDRILAYERGEIAQTTVQTSVSNEEG